MESPEDFSVKQAGDGGFSLEKMKGEISARIEQARNNPIAEERLAELEARLNKFTDDFIKAGSRSSEQISQEDAIEAEVLRSSAIADNIVEFREMLSQLADIYGDVVKGSNATVKEWAKDLLAHENAHANVAQATGHEWVGYATVFMKDGSGNLSGIQPLHFTKPKLEWGPKEMLSKNIEVTQAPEIYGNKLSESDIESLALDNQRLGAVRIREERDQRRLSEVRKELGI